MSLAIAGDVKAGVDVLRLFSPGNHTGDPVHSEVIDTANYVGTGLIVISSGALSALTVTIQEDTASNGATATTVSTAEEPDGSTLAVVDGDDDTVLTLRVNMAKTKRYLVVDLSGQTGAANLSAVLIATKAHDITV